jgi:hypothetical protein
MSASPSFIVYVISFSLCGENSPPFVRELGIAQIHFVSAYRPRFTMFYNSMAFETMKRATPSGEGNRLRYNLCDKSKLRQRLVAKAKRWTGFIVPATETAFLHG